MNHGGSYAHHFSVMSSTEQEIWLYLINHDQKSAALPQIYQVDQLGPKIDQSGAHGVIP